MTNATIWIAYNTDGDVFTSTEDAATALQELVDNFGEREGTRVVEMSLALPDIKPIKVTAEIPDTDGPVTVTIA